MRWAILENGIVKNVIIADEAFATEHSARLGLPLVEVAWPGDERASKSAIVTHDCEPGSSFDGASFTRAAPAVDEDPVRDTVLKVLTEKGLIQADAVAVVGEITPLVK